ncbi:MAG: SIMPL domain-containing protein [Acidobacteriia bacterium]|nr:SIMPL domain-containing protein [Terriglobia bacterium]
MPMRHIAIFLLATVCSCQAQISLGSNQNTISITGDAEVKVVPDRANVYLGVETRNKDIAAASAQNDTDVRQVIASIRQLGVDSTDIQTDFYHVEIVYSGNAGTIVDYYKVTKEIQVVLKDVSRFEGLLNTVLRAGANHVYGIDFSTSELRKHRDEARALAAKAAIEKANDLAAAAGMKVVGKPTSVSSYSYGGGSWYGRCCGYGYGNSMYQNVVQNVASNGGEGAQGTISLGKISVTASVTMTIQIQ